MSNVEHIKINIKKGVLTWHVQGVKGSGCHDLTKVLRAMSTEVIESKSTVEGDEGTPQKDTLTNGFGGGF